jgi:hypothetical protein
MAQDVCQAGQGAPRVGLFVTCLVDAVRPAVGSAAISLLQAAACRPEAIRAHPVTPLRYRQTLTLRLVADRDAAFQAHNGCERES